MMNLELYHGTSSYFAKQLLLGNKQSPLESSGAIQCASDLYELMIDAAGSFYEMAWLFPHDSGLGSVAPLALRNIHDRRADSLMSYGDFYASLNIKIASSYAANNPLGSELLRFLDGSIKALRNKGASGIDLVLERYPGLTNLLAQHHRPILLKLDGILPSRLTREDGTPFTTEDIKFYHECIESGVRAPGAVRIAPPIAPHICGIYAVEIRGTSAPPGFIDDDDISLLQLSPSDLVKDEESD